MGSFLTAFLQGVGRTGSEAAEGQDYAKKSRLEEQDRNLKLLQSQLAMSELQQKMKMNAAPQFVGSHADPTGQVFNTTRDPMSGSLTDKAGGKEAPKESWTPVLDESGNYVAFDKTTGKASPLELNGKPVRGVPKGKSGPLTVDGKPVGVWRGGKPLTPDSPDWTPQDAVQLATYLKTYGEAEENKNQRIERAARSRAAAWMQIPIGQYDSETNSFVSVSRDTVVKNPGRYGPPAPAMQIVNRNRLFNEIDATRGVMNDAIAKLPDDAFSPEARAQMALVLKDEAPWSAFQEFMHSNYATTLTNEQIDYVTALASLQESAMALRTAGGVPGAATDRVRGAIQKMLPGAGTPSKAYAIRQMRLFDVELGALRKNMPNAGAPKASGADTGQPPAGSTIIKWSDVK
jgi:hypothetical protein